MRHHTLRTASRRAGLVLGLAMGLMAGQAFLSPAFAAVSPPDPRDVAVTQPSTGTILSGSLRVASTDHPTTLMVIVAGSGGTDRDGNAFGASSGSNNLRLLADAMEAAGISSARFDKRVLPTAQPPATNSEIRFNMQVDDVVAWVDRFAKDPRFSRVVVVGHSEGALIGAQAVQRSKAAALVSIAGAADRLSDVLRRQINPKLPPPLVAEHDRVLKSLERGVPVDDVHKALAPIYPPEIQQFLISSFAVDPKTEFAKVKVPTLLVQGDTDFQVLVSDAIALAKAKPDASLCVIAGMNHQFKDAPTGDITSYKDPSLPLDATLVAALVSYDHWLSRPDGAAWVPVQGCRRQ